MVNAQLEAALDWRAEKGERRGRYSCRQGERWYIVEYGPGYSNTYRVTEHDEAGLQWLLQHELKGVGNDMAH